MFDRNDRARSILMTLAAEFIRNEANPSPLVTVMRVTSSPDFKNATIFVSVFPDEGEKEVLNFLKRRGGDFRDYVKERGAFKTLPFFDFKIDYGERNRQQVDDVARSLEEKEK